MEIGLGRIAFEPAFAEELGSSQSLEIAAQGLGWAELSWLPPEGSEESYLVEYLGEPWDEWTLAGYTPAESVGFSCIGLRPECDYRFRVRSFSENAVSPASQEVPTRSLALPQEPLE